MLTYTCEQCGMSVNGMKCAKCGADLVHDQITTDEGTVISVSKCPKGCGMIKSPMCCGADMTAS
jgi:hypothetical protein